VEKKLKKMKIKLDLYRFLVLYLVVMRNKKGKNNE
tara:strand:+ start:262 stop:366 length:105 start_codon:yes stop_codon:yes gene_type:complete